MVRVVERHETGRHATSTVNVEAPGVRVRYVMRDGELGAEPIGMRRAQEVALEHSL